MVDRPWTELGMKLLYPNFKTKILYEGYDKYLILEMEAISLSLLWLLIYIYIYTFDREKSYGINVRLQSKSLQNLSNLVGKEFKPTN